MDENKKVKAIEVAVRAASAWRTLTETLDSSLLPTVVGVKLLHPDAQLPKMQRVGDAAFDIYSVEDVEIPPGMTAAVDCGFGLEIPPGYKVMINGRSGLASRGIFCHVGTVDENYKGKLGTILYNLSKTFYNIKKGDRVGQISLQRVIPTEFEVVNELSTSVRGENGFGSSGK
jgi:dUTP pyrophosphatase